MTDAARMRFRRALLFEGVFSGLLWGGLAAAAALLAARVFAGAPAVCLASIALLPLGALVGAIVALRRTPSEAALAALTDDASHAGGLVLVQDLPGSDRWPRPAVTAPVVPCALLRPAIRLVFPALALTVAFLAPANWFESNTTAPTVFPDVMAPIRNELAEIRAEELLPPAEIEAVETELRRIEAAANPLKPGETLDAVDRLAERLNALLDLNEATVRRLTADSRELAAFANADKLAEQFKEMLASAPSSEDTMKDYRVCHSGQGEGEGGGEGEGEDEDGKPGSGAATRGRGDAPMDWTKQSEMLDSEFKDQARAAKSAKGRDVVKLGESVDDDDPVRHAVRTGGGVSTEVRGRATGVSVSRSVLPRHRTAVKRFFEPERNMK